MIEVRHGPTERQRKFISRSSVWGGSRISVPSRISEPLTYSSVLYHTRITLSRSLLPSVDSEQVEALQVRAKLVQQKNVEMDRIFAFLPIPGDVYRVVALYPDEAGASKDTSSGKALCRYAICSLLLSVSSKHSPTNTLEHRTPEEIRSSRNRLEVWNPLGIYEALGRREWSSCLQHWYARS
jgi:hypothetical protein